MESTTWQWDALQQLYYFFDAQAGDIVYQNGYRIPQRPTQTYSDPRYGGPTTSTSTSQYGRGHVADPRSGSASSLQRRSTASSASSSAALASNLSGLSLHSPPSSMPSSPYYSYQSPYNPQKYPYAQRMAARSVYSQLETTKRGTYPSPTQGDTRSLRPQSGTSESDPLHDNFKVRKHNFFCVGRVFLILWAEPAGSSDSTISGAGTHAESVHSKVRRFVVIREGKKHCSALPIHTYGSQGVAKSGVNKSEHAIVYTGREAPEPLASELPTRYEQGLRPLPIRIVPDEKVDRLDSLSRINYARVHTVEHNIKVKPFGNVHRDSMEHLITQFRLVWLESQTKQVSASTGARSSGGALASRSRQVSGVTGAESIGGAPASHTYLGQRAAFGEYEEEDEEAEEEDENEEEDEAPDSEDEY